MFERSFHFVPAHRRKLYDRLGDWSADAIIFDLEDAVAAEDKPEATTGLAALFDRSEIPDNWWVRINGLDHDRSAAECELLNRHPGIGLVLPKLSGPDELAEVARLYGSDRRIIALVESFAGVACLRDGVPAAPGLYGIGLGLEDLYSEMIFGSAELEACTRALRTEVVLFARAHGLLPIDTISLHLQDRQALERDAREARSCGMGAKFSIHPFQVPTINQVFSPGSEAVQLAARIVPQFPDPAAEAGYTRQGKELVTPPKIKQAHLIHTFATHHELET